MGTEDKPTRSGPQNEAGEMKNSQPERGTSSSKKDKKKKKKEKKKEEKKEEVDKKSAQKTGADEDPHVCCGCRFPVVLALLQLILGLAILVIAIVMKGTSSSLPLRDTPYWVGIIICLAGFLGFYMYCIVYQVDEQTSLQFIIKLTYFLLSAFGLVLCVSAVAFAAYHYNQMTTFSCQMSLDECVCKQDPDDKIARNFRYSDVADCSAVTRTLKVYLLLQMVLNLTVAVLCLWGCYVMWKHRYQVFFVGILFQSLKPIDKQQPNV